ncbi:MAG: amidohydrolase family protein [Lacunisphaera sp.]|nr:amidohydrolase family protein [Lacunisphaera sp.]
MKIDAHHHFWRYTPEEFGWISDDLGALRRNFYPADLAPVLAAANVDGTVVVQARQMLEETMQLLEHSHRHAFIKGVVGWVPLTDPKIPNLLDELREEKKLKGVRHVLQDEPDAYLAEPAFNAGLRAVAAHGLSYDLLVKAPQLPAAIALVDRHPNLAFVLDHLAKPVITGRPPAEWRRDLAELARRPNVCCKFSGVVTEVLGLEWTPELLWPYFDVVLTAFGADRLMFGSDWPVCLVATEYSRWDRFVESCVTGLAPPERKAILGDTAAKFYRLTR